MSIFVPVRISTALAFGVACFVFAPTSQAAVTVIGSGIAHDCYVAVKQERIPPERAVDICDRALNEEQMTLRNRAATLVNRGILYMRSGDYERALKDYDGAIRIKDDLWEAQVNRGAALFNLNRHEEAKVALTIGLQSEDEDARVAGYYNRGLANEKLGDLTSAYYDFKSALEIDPNFKPATDQLARFTVTVVRE